MNKWSGIDKAVKDDFGLKLSTQNVLVRPWRIEFEKADYH
jgi:hypothetical protein